MRSKSEFLSLLQDINSNEYTDYRKLVGDFDFIRYLTKIDRVQSEPDGEPTIIVVRVPQSVAAFPPHLFNTPVRRTALEDFLSRTLADELEELVGDHGQAFEADPISVIEPNSCILPRSSLIVSDDFIEARFYVSLPERDGLIDGAAAEDLFFDLLPVLVNASMFYFNLDADRIEDGVNQMEDADQIRQLLPTRGWVAFLAEGTEPGFAEGCGNELGEIEFDDRIVTDLEVLNTGVVRGAGIPAGLTVILGDDYSGRIELMDILASGIYNHVPGGGREMSITVPDAVTIQAEPGRSVQRVDISAFLDTSDPDSGEERLFSSDQADAIASQAASLVEALEVGAKVLLIDESDSAPGFLSRDSRIPASSGRTVLHPLASRARALVDQLNISIVVAGQTCVPEFIPIADTVLRIDGGKLSDVTEEMKAVAIEAMQADEDGEPDFSSLQESSRWVVPSSVDPSLRHHDAYIEVLTSRMVQFGRSIIDLEGVSQVADIYQAETIAIILNYLRDRYLDEGRSIAGLMDIIDRDLSTEGLDCLMRDAQGRLARPRRYEIAAALNRIPSLRIAQIRE